MVGYCAPNTLGGVLRSGAKSVHIFGENLQVLADVVTMDSFSAHGDQEEMYNFLSNQKATAQKIFLVHGTLDRQEKWRDYLQEQGFKSVDIPTLGEEITV